MGDQHAWGLKMLVKRSILMLSATLGCDMAFCHWCTTPTTLVAPAPGAELLNYFIKVTW